MSTNERIAASIRKIAGGHEGKEDGFNIARIYDCTVDAGSIDESQRTCSCTNMSGITDVNLENVQLMSGINDGILCIPAEESFVRVAITANGNPFIVQYSELDKIFYVAGGSTFLLYSNGAELNGKNYGGVMQVAPSVKAWNDLQNDINSLKKAFAEWSPVPNDGGAALKASLTANYSSTPLTITKQSDIENTTVLHGNGE